MTTKRTNKPTTKNTNLKVAKKPAKAKAETFTFLDLGCGGNKTSIDYLFTDGIIPLEKKEGAVLVGVDFKKVDGVDKVVDLTKFPYPFADNSIDGVYSSHFLEHLDGEQRIKFFDEMQRIMKPGAKIRTIVPYWKSSRAQWDCTHKFPMVVEESFNYWNKGWREANRLQHYYGNGTCNFSVVHTHYFLQDQEWSNKNKDTQAFAAKHYFNVISDMLVDMVKL